MLCAMSSTDCCGECSASDGSHVIVAMHTTALVRHYSYAEIVCDAKTRRVNTQNKIRTAKTKHSMLVQLLAEDLDPGRPQGIIINLHTCI